MFETDARHLYEYLGELERDCHSIESKNRADDCAIELCDRIEERGFEDCQHPMCSMNTIFTFLFLVVITIALLFQ